MPEFDAIVVGANVAGATAATLLARHGCRVALVEKSPDPAHHKKLCTHEILPLATPVFARLGVLDEVRQLGGERGATQTWSPYGWSVPGEEGADDATNIRRELLDPLLRSVAVREPGVELHAGEAVFDLLRGAGGRPAGVRLRASSGAERELRGRVVIGADGAGSTVGRLAGLDAEHRPHERFGYAGYFDGVPAARDAAGRRVSRIWFQNPDMAYAFVTDSGLTLIAVAPVRTPERLPAFKADLNGEFRRAVEALPDAPNLSHATQVGRYRGLVKGDNLRRPPAGAGVALVGDAAQVADFVFGAGCGFAIAAAEWLADAVGPQLAAGAADEDVDAALGGYARRFRRRLGPHYELISDYSTGRPMNVMERALFRGAVDDQHVAKALVELAGRTQHPMRTLTPAVLARAGAVAVRRRARSRTRRGRPGTAPAGGRAGRPSA